MFKKIFSTFVIATLVFSLSACTSSKPAETKAPETTVAETTAAEETEEVAEEAEEPAEEADDMVEAEAPGESGFVELPIGEEQQVGPYNVAAVYFQPVDMYPEGKNPSKEDSDMHLEADIHFIEEYAVEYGFGAGDEVWPAYLTVKYEVMDKDGKTVTEGSFMPMNASDGPHYGANLKKGLLTVGQYTLKLTIEPPTDYLLHVDDETGVPAKQGAAEYFKTLTAEFEWNYTGEQLQNN